jgi:hypothetical protein
MKAAERAAQRRYNAAWKAFYDSLNRLRKMVERDGGKLQVDIKVTAAKKAKK